MRKGFSLVELSIVLVILGLLVGGVLAGQSLIRAAELRAVGAEYQRWQTAMHAFRDKYFHYPGDMPNATEFWGRMNSNADCVRNNSTASVTSGGVCDGNGDGRQNFPTAASQAGESFQFWRHLATAGLIEGSYSGQTGPMSVNQALLNENTPASKMGKLGWSLRHITVSTGDAANFAVAPGNQFIFGAVFIGTGPVYGLTYGGGLKAEEAWNIDTKTDDGKPATGKAITYNRDDCTNSTSATDYSSEYLLNSTTTRCGFYFPRAF